MDIALALTINACFWAGCWLLVRHWLKRDGLDGVLVTVVVGSATLFFSMQALSFLNALTFWPMLTLAVGIALAGVVSHWRHRTEKNEELRSDDQPDSYGLVAIFLGFAAWISIRQLVRGLVLPVAPVSDAPIYHLFFAVSWWQSGDIHLLATPFGELAATYFPANGSLWFTWLIIGCDSELFAKVGQWPFFIASAATIFGLARQLGGTLVTSCIPAAMWCALPLSHFYASIANVDLIYTAFYLLAVYFLFEMWRLSASGQTAISEAILFGLAVGCAVGTKTVALAFLPLLLAAAFIPFWRCRNRLLTTFAAGGASLLPGSYWYLRNFFLTGNPLYPLEIQLIDIPLFPGWYRSEAMLQSGYHIPTEQWQLLIDRLTLLVGLKMTVLWGVCILAAIVTPVVTRFTTQRKAQADSPPASIPTGAMVFTCGAMAAFYLVLYWYAVPYNTQERFLAPALGIGLAPLGRWLSKRRWLQWVMAILLAWQIFLPIWGTRLFDIAGPRILPTSIVLTFGSWDSIALPVGIVLSAVLLRRRRKLVRYGVAAILLGGAAVATGWPLYHSTSDNPMLRFYPPVDFGLKMYPAWQTLEQNTGKSGATVAYTGTNLPYYLFGIGLRNRVRYINVNAPADRQMHEYRQDNPPSPDPWPQWYRDNPDYRQWVRNLEELGVQYLFVARENMHGRRYEGTGLPPFPIEYQWAIEHPERFQLLGPQAPVSGQPPWACVFRFVPN